MYSEQNLKIITYYDINKLESLTLDTLSNCNMIEELFKFPKCQFKLEKC